MFYQKDELTLGILAGQHFKGPREQAEVRVTHRFSLPFLDAWSLAEDEQGPKYPENVTAGLEFQHFLFLKKDRGSGFVPEFLVKCLCRSKD